MDPEKALTFAEESLEYLRQEIKDARGQEVMFAAAVNGDRVIINVRAVARGNDMSVPALLQQAEKGDVIIHNHPSGILKPSQADLGVASYLGNQGIGFIIISNDADQFYTVAEPLAVRKIKKIRTSKLGQLFSPGGSLSGFMDDYEMRDCQVEMLNEVAESMNEGRISVIEAGTGVGKSLAYLVPAIRWVSDNDERIVISTATINLQQQLMEKDIPLAQKVLGRKVKTVLVKGRGNYICLRRLYEELDEPSLFDEEKEELNILAEWAAGSPSGNRTELPGLPDPQIWQRVCSETDVCTGLRCKHREDCFIIRARKEAAQAGLLVVNHHLLFSDIALRIAGIGYENSAVLPPFQKIIFDEAHSMEKSATSFFSRIFTRNSIIRQLNRLHSSRKGSSRGLLSRLSSLFTDTTGYPDFIGQLNDLKNENDFLNEKCLYHLADSPSLRITAENMEFISGNIFPALSGFRDKLVGLLNNLQKLVSMGNEILEADDEHLYELKGTVNRLDEINAIICDFLTKAPADGQVFWMERKSGAKGERWVEFSITPVDISKIMREAVFSQYSSIICTSATLQVNKSFEYWMKRLGLADIRDREVRTSFFPSPFPYRTNTLLCIPTDSPDPSSALYSESVKRQLYRLLELTEGRALVLFTSYTMLQDVYSTLKPALEKLSIRVFRQGDDDRNRLLESFRNDTGSVLFATDSFWEGVDSPGETLQVVVICRLPFRVPSDPIVKARMEAIEKRGGNPFLELSVPEAVMKFKQGFGRLMRKKNDRGIVIIYDSRIISKFYGKFFLNSLPETGMSVKEHESVLLDIENFLY